MRGLGRPLGPRRSADRQPGPRGRAQQRAPSWGFSTAASLVPRGPGEQEGLGMNGGVRLTAEGTRGVGLGPFNSPTSRGGKEDTLRVPASLRVTPTSPEAAETEGEPGGGPGTPGSGRRGVPVRQGRLGEAGGCGVVLASAQGPLVHSAWLRTEGYRMTLSPQRPAGQLSPPGPGCLTEPLHHLGKQTLGRQPSDPTQGCWKWREGRRPPVTERALGQSRRDPSPSPSPPLCGPLLPPHAGFMGCEAWERRALGRGVTV